MNKVILVTLFLSLLITSCSKEDKPGPKTETEFIQNSCDFINFKYYNGNQQDLGYLSNDYILIAVDTINNDSVIQYFVSTLNQFDQSYNYTIYTSGQYKFKQIPLKLSSSKNCEEITQIISDLEQNTIIDYVHYTMKTDACTNLIGNTVGNLCVNSYSSSFYVNVFDENNLTDLNQMITQTNTELVGQIQFMAKWFELRATKNSNGDALAMANYFYESGLFEHSEPSMSKIPVE